TAIPAAQDRGFPWRRCRWRRRSSWPLWAEWWRRSPSTEPAPLAYSLPMRIERLGHACLLVEGGDSRLLVDPGGFSTAWHDLEDVDAVLITHQHADHVDPEHLAPLVRRTGARAGAEEPGGPGLAGEGVGARGGRVGYRIDLGSGEVGVAGGIRSGIHPAIPRVGNVGYVLSEAGSARLYHPGDS